jgi:hypothetical protein
MNEGQVGDPLGEVQNGLEMDTSCIKYGSIISISHFEDEHSFIYSDGFVKTNILLKNFIAPSKKNYCFNRSLFLLAPIFPNNMKNEALQYLKDKGLNIIETILTKESEEITSLNTGFSSENDSSSESVTSQVAVDTLKSNNTAAGKQTKLEKERLNEALELEEEEKIEKQRDLFEEVKHTFLKSEEGNPLLLKKEKKARFELSDEAGRKDTEKSNESTSRTKLASKLKGNNKKKKNSLNVARMESSNLDERTPISEMIGKVKTEYRYNVDLYEKMKNVPVLFKQPFQLIHLASNKFLACHDIEAEFERESLRLQLEEYPSDSTAFQFLPAFKYQNFSDLVIPSGQTVKIVHMNQRLHKFSYFHCSEELSLIRRTFDAYRNENFLHSESQEGPQIDVGESDSNYRINKREVNASFDDATLWRLWVFSSGIQEKDNKVLNCGDIVWFHHSEMSALLAARKEGDFGEELNEDPNLKEAGESQGTSYNRLFRLSRFF